jgi:hypothetical protein
MTHACATQEAAKAALIAQKRAEIAAKIAAMNAKKTAPAPAPAAAPAAAVPAGLPSAAALAQRVADAKKRVADAQQRVQAPVDSFPPAHRGTPADGRTTAGRAEEGAGACARACAGRGPQDGGPPAPAGRHPTGPAEQEGPVQADATQVRDDQGAPPRRLKPNGR